MTRRQTTAYLGRLLTEADNRRLSDRAFRQVATLALDLAVRRLNRPRKPGPTPLRKIV